LSAWVGLPLVAAQAVRSAVRMRIPRAWAFMTFLV
jgi:hypothetical protein